MLQQEAEERFMGARSLMERHIAHFYDCCKEIDIDNAGFAEDVNAAVEDVTDGEVVFDDWLG